MKVDPAATAQALARQLLRRLPHAPGGEPRRDRPGGAAAAEVEARVLEAAAFRFAQLGVSGTTMAQLAKDAGISREWLYRHFRNRNAVLAALAWREIEDLLAGVAERAAGEADVVDRTADAFAFVLDTARSHPLLLRIVADEPQRITATVAAHGDAVFSAAVDAVTTLLVSVGGVDPERAPLVAETLCRVALAVVIAPSTLRGPEATGTYARGLVGALLAPSPSSPPAAPAPAR